MGWIQDGKKFIMSDGFIIYPGISSIHDANYEMVSDDDPIRQILKHIPTFEKAIVSISASHFQQRYGVFVHVLNPASGMYKHETNLFFEQDRNFTILGGVYKGTRLTPVPPIRVYKWIQSNQVDCMGAQNAWMVGTVFSRMLSDRSSTIRFLADKEVRDVSVSKIIQEQLCTHPEIPLLVLTTAKGSLDFAEIVMDLLHCCSKTEMMAIVRDTGLSRKMSVDRVRKMYDIFPEEYLHLPKHMWNFLRSIDHYELSPEDVQELVPYYKSC